MRWWCAESAGRARAPATVCQWGAGRTPELAAVSLAHSIHRTRRRCQAQDEQTRLHVPLGPRVGPRVFPSRFRKSACNRHGTKPKANSGPAPHATRAHTHAQLHRQHPSKGSMHQLKHLCEVTLCFVVQGGTSTASSTGSVTGRRLSTHDGACVAARWQEPQVSHSRLNRAGARSRAA